MIFIHRGLFLHSFYKTMVLDFTSFLYIGNCETLDIESGKSYTIRRYVKQMEKRKMIFCVEDDSNIRELVVYTLNATGMNARGFGDGKRFMEALETETPELILLDIMLPGEDGLSILRKLKSSSKTKHIPVIMVTAKGNEYDKVIGLDAGADDYVAKPFGMMELVSRIKAVLRRTKPVEEVEEYVVGNLRMELNSHEVFVDDQLITLTYKEFELLRKLMKYRKTVLTRDRLLEEIWGYGYVGETRTVDVHIRTLRQKLGSAGDMIETVRGVGYRIGGSYGE